MDDWTLFTVGEAEYRERIGRVNATRRGRPAPAPGRRLREALARALLALADWLAPAPRSMADAR
jgi:hypothetical protein